MNIELRSKMALEDCQRDWIDRRAGFALDRFLHRLDGLEVAFEDLNGVRGGLGVRCRVEAVQPDGRRFRAEAIGTSVEASSSIALSKLRLIVARQGVRERDSRIRFSQAV